MATMPSGPTAITGRDRFLWPDFGANDGTIGWIPFVIFVVLYKFSLDLAYMQVAQIYDYQRLFLLSGTPMSALLSWVMLLVAIPAMKVVFADKTASGNIMSLLSLFSVVPTITCIAYRSDYPVTYIVLVGLFWILMFFAWALMRPIRITFLTKWCSPYVWTSIFAVLAGAVLLYSYINTGIRLHFDLIGVYEIRAEARQYVAPFGLNYLVSMADNLLPIIAVYLLDRKRYLLFTAALVVVFINFSISGTKMLLFIPLIGILAYWGLKRYSQSWRLIIGCFVFTTLCILEAVVTSSIMLNGLFTYRVIFIPTELNFSYYDYFQYHPFLYFSQSFLKVFAPENQENIQFIIGEYAVSDYSARANNGLFSDAYSNMGVIGVVVFPFLYALLLRLFDGALAGLPQRMNFVVVLATSFVLISLTLTQAMVNSGLLLAIVFLYSLPRRSPGEDAVSPGIFFPQEPRR